MRYYRTPHSATHDSPAVNRFGSYELALNPEHLQYLEPLNTKVLALKKDTDVEAFNSQSAFIRSTLSPMALCGLVSEDVFREKVRRLPPLLSC